MNNFVGNVGNVDSTQQFTVKTLEKYLIVLTFGIIAFVIPFKCASNSSF